jgi:hypothetical protein
MKIVGIDGYRVTIHYNRGFYKILVIIYDSMTIYVKIVIYIYVCLYIYIFIHMYIQPLVIWGLSQSAKDGNPEM